MYQYHNFSFQRPHRNFDSEFDRSFNHNSGFDRIPDLDYNFDRNFHCCHITAADHNYYYYYYYHNFNYRNLNCYNLDFNHNFDHRPGCHSTRDHFAIPTIAQSACQFLSRNDKYLLC